MGWYVFTKEDDCLEGTSLALRSEMAAISFARALITAGVEVARIEGPDTEIILGDKIAERFVELRRARETGRRSRTLL